MTLRRIFSIRNGILVGVIGLGVLGWWIWSRGHNPQGTRKITIAQAGDFFLYAPLYLAHDAGFFTQHHLEVSIVSTGGDEKTWAAVVSRSASFGIADPTFIAISGAHGQPGRVIASIVNGVPFWGITFESKITPFAGPTNLNGYVVATFPSPSTAFTLQKRMFMQAGLEPHIREGAFGTLLAMLHANQADIALELEPNVSQAVSGGAHVVYSMPQLYGDFAITGLTATPALLHDDPDLATNVVCALQEALDFAHRHSDAALQMLVKRFPEVNPSVAKDALRRVMDAGIIPKDARVSTKAWSNAVSLRVEVGDLTTPASMASYVDNSFADSALRSCSAGGQ